MAEFKNHVKDTVRTDPVRQVLGGDAVGLAHREDVRAVLDRRFEGVEIVQNTIGVGGHGVDADCAVAAVRCPIQELGRLLDVGDGVHTETADALVHPEIGHIVQRLSDLWIFPIEVWLLRKEGVEVVLASGLVKLPGRAAENAAPVGGGAAVLFGIRPNIPVALLVVRA